MPNSIRHFKSKLFPTGVGVTIADELDPLVAKLSEAKDQHPLDVLGGIGMTLTRHLGRAERNSTENLEQWTREFCSFVLERFGNVTIADEIGIIHEGNDERH